MSVQLSAEQAKFIRTALSGQNVLVDACIGSGKTTAIQELCNRIPRNKRILYLTYNKLLKLDAKARIYGNNVYVTNYHGFGYMELMNAGVRAGISDIIQTYNKVKPSCAGRFDVLILDEYQDIEQETSEMLRHIKAQNPGIQIIAVGDMAQKIYDKTILDAAVFIDRLLDKYVRLEFTLCFRLSRDWADTLGEIWGKRIVGANPSCTVEIMDYDEAFDVLASYAPDQLLCLGANHAQRTYMLNDLEQAYPDKFNKNTVWSKVSESDGSGTQPGPNCAIFTTFDGCKGMERPVCAVFDWTEQYWYTRTTKPGAKYEILRNIFCVAASRGKDRIILVRPRKGTLLNKRDLMQEFDMRTDFADMAFSDMFNFKYAEDVEASYEKLDVTEIRKPAARIDLPIQDGMIDLSMCIGLCMKSEYFTGFDIDKAIDVFFELHKDVEFKRVADTTGWSVEQKILYLTSLETNQNRYWTQVSVRFMTPEKRDEIQARLRQLLPPDAEAQKVCQLDFRDFKSVGYADVVHDGTVYGLCFSQEITHTDVLLAAVCAVSLGLRKIRVWNLHDDQLLEIKIPDKRGFMNQVARTATKGALTKFHGFDNRTLMDEFVQDNYDACVEYARFVADYVARTKTQPPAPKTREFFKARGLVLPINTKQFAKLFGPLMKDLSHGKRE